MYRSTCGVVICTITLEHYNCYLIRLNHINLCKCAMMFYAVWSVTICGYQATHSEHSEFWIMLTKIYKRYTVLGVCDLSIYHFYHVRQCCYVTVMVSCLPGSSLMILMAANSLEAMHRACNTKHHLTFLSHPYHVK